jgi:hypothetical protein
MSIQEELARLCPQLLFVLYADPRPLLEQNLGYLQEIIHVGAEEYCLFVDCRLKHIMTADGDETPSDKDHRPDAVNGKELTDGIQKDHLSIIRSCWIDDFSPPD